MFFKKKSNGEPKKKKALWKRLLKWTGISFFLLLILIIALPFIFEKQIFEKVKSTINENLNAKFECKDYSLTLISTFPNFTLELNQVSLSGVEEFEGVQLFGSESILVTIDLYSAIWGDQIDIRNIRLKKTDVNVLVLENGKANYDIAIPDSTKAQNGVDTSEASPFSLKVRSYALENANITYDDRAGGTYARIANLNHSGTGDFTQDLFEFTTTTTADTININLGGIPYMKNTKLDSKLDFDMDMANMKFTFKPEDYVQLNDFKLGFDGFLAMPNDMDMDINFEAKQTDFKNIYSLIPAIFTADFNSIKFGGKTEFKGFVKGKLAENSMPAFNLDFGIKDGSFQYPGLPKSASGIQVKANVNSKGAVNMDDIIVDVAQFDCNLGGNTLASFLYLVNPMSDPGIKAGLDAHFNLATLREVIPMEKGAQLNGLIDTDVKIDGRMSTIEKGDYENFKASGKIVAKEIVYTDEATQSNVNLKVMEFIFAPTHLELAQFDAQVDQTQLQAKGKLTNYLAYVLKGETIKGNFDLNSPLLDLRSMMSESSSTTETTGTTTSTTTSNTDALAESHVLVIPKNIDFTMKSTIGKIIYPNTPGKPDIELTNLFGQISLVEGVMYLNDLKFNTLEANVKMSGSYDSRDVSAPDVKFNFDIANLDLKKAGETYNIIEKLAPIASKCTGKISTKLDFNTKLNKQMEPDYNTMFGKGNLSTKSLYIEGFEPLNKLAEKLKIKSLAKQNIENVSLSYKFENGRVYIDPYDVVINKYKTSIAGSTGFDQTIEYVMNMAIPRSEFGGAANGVLDEMMNKANAKAGTNISVGEIINVQAKIGGTITDPKIETDMKEKMTDLKQELKEEIKEKIIEKVEEVKEDVKAKASAEAEKLMKDAEEKAAQLRAEAKKAADKVRAEGKSSGDKLIEEAGNNPLKTAAAKKGADKLNKEAEEKAQKIEKEADEKAQKVLDEAREKADKLK